MILQGGQVLCSFFVLQEFAGRNARFLPKFLDVIELVVETDGSADFVQGHLGRFQQLLGLVHPQFSILGVRKRIAPPLPMSLWWVTGCWSHPFCKSVL